MAKPLRKSRQVKSMEENLFQDLQDANNENEVRHKICSELNISSEIRMFGSTDGIYKDVLFEFKFDKKFNDAVKWNKSAYGTLAQSIYYCRRILNFEYDGIYVVPHTIVICDKNGAFIVPTKSLEWIIQFDPTEELDCSNNQEWVRYSEDYEFLKNGGFTWTTPPSSQNPLLVELLMEKELLKNISYLDFKDSNQFKLFIQNAKNSNGELPKIQITQQNFIRIFDQWFTTFAPAGESRRDWVDRFVIDLRLQYSLDKSKGMLTNKVDQWRVPVDIYESFWKIYKRPPTVRVDEFIATNKDLLYDVADQNNNGDFYTPLKLVNMAHQVVSKHIQGNKPRLWWDPAAGGGNLFFKFNQNQKVILSTKFESDANGLKNNPSVKSDLVITLDFINHLIENDLTLTDDWKRIEKLAKTCDEIVFFMNPPFDDQAESRGSNNSLPKNFLQDDLVSARSLRALHSRFLYRIKTLSKVFNKPMWVACFSKTAWIVGPDSESFYKEWSDNFKYNDGFIVSSKVFNGTKAEWPCLFSLWSYTPDTTIKNKTSEIKLPVYDSEYKYLGEKTLQPFNSANQRLSDLPKLYKKALGSKSDYVKVVPLKNEYEVSEIVYEDTMPEHSLGYLRVVANDVYNSTQRVQIYSSMCGPSNHNGIAIVEENFLDSLFVYGARKSVRRNWLNDKDEFYYPVSPSKKHLDLKRMCAVYSIVEGAYASSMENLKYENKKYSFRNHLSIPSILELKNWGADDIPNKDSQAFSLLKSIKNEMSDVESEAVKLAKALIKESFLNDQRAKGDTKRQLWRGDAGIRQIINGLLEYKGASIGDDLEKAYQAYSTAKESLRKEIEKMIYKLNVLLPFEAYEEDGLVPLSEIIKATKRAKQITEKNKKTKKAE
ncbi:MAG: hypothetical protein JNM24_02330 [Bdellovibrionaceae bacterium]|nr:hypothetical protein [Pseudobdellovibrionaceae bacterium]